MATATNTFNPTSAAGPFDLAELDDIYTEAEAPKFTELPDGKYQMVIDGFTLAGTKKDNTPMLTWELRVISGEYAGKKEFHRRVLVNDPDKIKWVKGDLSACGFTGKISELQTDEGRAKLINVCLEVGIRTSKPGTDGKTFRNLNIVKKLDIDIENIPPGGSESVDFAGAKKMF